jgi:hypothetical protein
MPKSSPSAPGCRIRRRGTGSTCRGSRPFAASCSGRISSSGGRNRTGRKRVLRLPAAAARLRAPFISPRVLRGFCSKPETASGIWTITTNGCAPARPFFHASEIIFWDAIYCTFTAHMRKCLMLRRSKCQNRSCTWDRTFCPATAGCTSRGWGVCWAAFTPQTGLIHLNLPTSTLIHPSSLTPPMHPQFPLTHHPLPVLLGPKLGCLQTLAFIRTANLQSVVFPRGFSVLAHVSSSASLRALRFQMPFGCGSAALGPFPVPPP